jgi:hypothetical protein
MVTLDFAATILLAADRRSGLRRVDPFSTPPRCRIRWFSPVLCNRRADPCAPAFERQWRRP